jgi:hypothetical protein
MSESRSPLIRDADAPRNLEIFLVSAIATIVLTRGYLIITGYPQIGGGTLHIAHMLWGGLLMLVAIVLFTSYLNLSIRIAGALTGGIGFGLFIDEIGKFITADNNYFFQPTFAILYVIFLGLFMGLRAMFWAVPLDDHEEQINAEVRGISALRQGKQFRLVAWYVEVEDRARGAYRKVAGSKRFRLVLILSFIVIGLGHAVSAISTFVTQGSKAGWIDSLYLGSTLLSGLFILVGMVRLSFNRLQALRLFRIGMLVSLAVTQLFLFYANELAAMWGLLVDLATYAALNTAITLEAESSTPSRRSGIAG